MVVDCLKEGADCTRIMRVWLSIAEFGWCRTVWRTVANSVAICNHMLTIVFAFEKRDRVDLCGLELWPIATWPARPPVKSH